MRSRYKKFEGYMVLVDDVVVCNRCRSRIEVSGMKTMAYLSEDA